MIRHFDKGTIVVIIITIVLFAVALFQKGLTKDILLEAGVLLVSVKLILMAYKTGLQYLDLKKDINEIKKLLNQEKNK